MLKEKYEISLWEDYLVPTTYNEETKTTTPEHYAERKLAVIGSNTMTAQWRAIEPKLVENINGTNTFTFKMYYTYIDNETGEKVQNPFSKLMVNERKVKAFWKNKWYDLVIKSIQEDSNGKSYTYTCKDLFVNELSKTGFDLEFDEKLGNNLGTVTELGERVVEGTDWKIGESDIIEQLTEEAVFEVSGIDMTGSFEVDGTTISTEEDAKLLVFYSTVINQNPLFQFLYSETGEFTTEENEMLVVNMPVFSVDGAQWSKNEEVYTVEIGEAVITFSLTEKVSARYRAKRPVRQQKQVYDPAIEEYVYVYKDVNEKEVYGVEHTEFNSPIVVVNLLANYSNFSDTEGWLTNQGEGAITFWQLPEYTADDWANYQGISYLRLLVNENQTGNFLNRGIKLNTQYLPDGFMPDEKYIVRIKAFEISNDALGAQVFVDGVIKPSIGEYNKTNYNIETSYFSTSIVPYKENDEWLEYELTCDKALSRSDLLTTSNFGLVFQLSKSLYIQEVQLFKEVFGEQVDIVNDEEIRTQVRINPGEIEKQGIIKPVYIYYDPNDEVNSQATSWEDLVALQRVYEKSNDYTPVYNTEKVIDKDGNEKQIEQKIRSITAKNSNRFNLLQQLAETFECWVRFDIEHELDGAIKLINGLPQKTITFKQEVGQKTGIGFVYGIDLKQISRTINSDKITSKVIVQPNINELAEDGICTIASSTENYSRASFILNFDYYINHGLLDGNALTKDLYLTTSDSIGYYYNLNRLNTNSQLNAKTLAEQKKVQLEQEAMLKTYSEALTAAEEEVIQLENDIIQQASVSKWEEVEAFATANPTNADLISKMQAKARMEVNKANYQKLVDSLTEAKENLDTSIELLNKTQDNIVEEIKALDKKFYEKYSRYIQEGSWTSQDYIDPNYYYLDAQSVAYTSSRPQITYNISVLRLSALEEYRNKIFHLGDISFVEDVEFFGYIPYSENVTNMTPYREQVLVSEITSNFDSPEKDSFKVQNYKTQFEDLFQRITATTQSLSYASGEYQRAANVIEPDGTINTLTLANSLAVNQNLVISAQNETVIQDNTGITLIDASNPNNKVKLTSGGIFLSADGGLTWKGGIRGTGISTQYLTAGSINTNNIVIQDGNHTAFRWDSDGINAFSRKEGENSQGEAYSYTDLNTFVRFDQYGVYGINGWSGDKTFSPENEKEIWDNANFGMTWEGFFVKNRQGKGHVEVSSKNDIAVFEGEKERIKIGRLNSDLDPNYGIRISNSEGAVVMESDDNGELWLKNRLRVGTNDTSTVEIGYLDAVREGTEIHEVIHAGDGEQKFVVYEDGKMIAQGAEFKGTIIATGGQIGNLTVGDVEGAVGNMNSIAEQTRKLDIVSKLGYTFKVEGGTPNTDSLILESEVVGFELHSIAWYGSSNFEDWGTALSTEETYTLTYNDFKEKSFSSTYYIKAVARSTDGKEYATWKTIMAVSDGEKGEGVIVQSVIYRYAITESSNQPSDNNFIYTTIPNVPPGQYLWIRTTTNYSDGTSMNSYSYSYMGQNGTPGEGENAYIIEANQEEILKFTSINGETTSIDLEPNILRLKLYSAVLNNGEKQYLSPTSYSLKFELSGLLGSEIEVVKWFSIDDILTENNLINSDSIQTEININNLSLIENIQSLLLNQDNILKISAIQNHRVIAIKILPIRFAMTQDLLKFNVHANGLTAAIQDAGLSFTSDGLSIDGANFQIISSGEKVFFIDENTGSLITKGIVYASGGEFTGTVYAESGSFTGTVNADRGTLGDLKVNGLIQIGSGLFFDGAQGAIYSPEVDGSYNFLINADGSAYAKNLTLGDGAKIENYIELGNNVYLYGDGNSDVVLKVTDNLSINKNGTIQLGNIFIDGRNSTIYSNWDDNRSGWKLSEDTSIFNNIVARGSIKTSVLEYGEVQAVGGIVLVRPSSIITSAKKENEAVVITLENRNGFKEGDWCRAGKNAAYYQIEFKDSNKVAIDGNDFNREDISQAEDKAEIILLNSGDIEDANSLIGSVLVDFGTTGEIGISINSSNNDSLVPGRAITVFETKIEESNNISFDNHIIIGEIPKNGNYGGLSGYGLYADNVVVKGSMVATDINYSSGISTNSGALMNGTYEMFPNVELADVLIWAGASRQENNYSSYDISNANFRVDRNGNLYASSGYFKGTIITDATIRAAIIQTAVLEGIGQEQEPPTAALTIKNTNFGIDFKGNNNESLFSLTSNEANFNIPVKLNQGIQIGSSNDNPSHINMASIFPVIYLYKEGQNFAMELTPQGVGFGNNGLQYIDDTKSQLKTQFNFVLEENQLNIKSQNNKILSMLSDQTNFHNKVKLDEHLLLGDKVSYQQVTGGYDIYIND